MTAEARLRYAEALRLARYCVQNRADEDTLQGYDISAEKLSDTADALRELARILEETEREAARHDPAICTCLSHIGQQLVATLAAGFTASIDPERAARP